LPPGGLLTCLELDAEVAAIAEQGWQRAGVRERIELMVGDARLSLDELLGREDGPGCFDLVFIDADKEGYALYLEAALALLRPGGTVMVDDSLWSGRVVDGGETDPETEAIRALNARLARDPRVRTVLDPIGDGVTLAVKLPAWACPPAPGALAPAFGFVPPPSAETLCAAESTSAGGAHTPRVGTWVDAAAVAGDAGARQFRPPRAPAPQPRALVVAVEGLPGAGTRQLARALAGLGGGDYHEGYPGPAALALSLDTRGADAPAGASEAVGVEAAMRALRAARVAPRGAAVLAGGLLGAASRGGRGADSLDRVQVAAAVEWTESGRVAAGQLASAGWKEVAAVGADVEVFLDVPPERCAPCLLPLALDITAYLCRRHIGCT